MLLASRFFSTVFVVLSNRDDKFHIANVYFLREWIKNKRKITKVALGRGKA